MYPISSLYDQYLQERARQWIVKLDIAGTEYEMDAIIDFSVENNLTSGDDFEIGTAIYSKLVFRLKTSNDIPPNARVVPYIALILPPNEDGANVAWQDADFSWEDADFPWQGAITEWLPLGEFFVDRRERIGDVWEFVCYDKLVYADVPYISQLQYPATQQQIWDEICTSLGYTYDGSVVIGSYTVPVAPTGYTKRQVMGFIAAANGANVYVGKDGTIKFRRYAHNETPVVELSDADYISVKETGPIKTYTKVVVVYDVDEGLAYEAGSGDENHTLYVECPFATQEIANALLVQLYGYSFTPIKMDARGYPQIEAGDRIRFGKAAPELTWETADEAWQDADFSWDSYYDGGESLALNITFGFKGGLSLAIDAPAKSEQESEFGVDGSISAAINRLNKNAVKLGKTYFGMTVTADEGLTIERSDHASKLVLNSDELSWYVGNQQALYFDAQAGKLKYSGDIEMLGGSISWSNVNSPDIGDIPDLSGYLTYIGPTGIYTGTIKTDQLIAGTAKISSALIDNIKASQIDVSEGKITTAQIESLVVGDNVIMGPNATISWGQVTGAPPIPTLPSYIQSTYIDSTNIISPNVAGGVITGGTIQTSSSGTYPRIELNSSTRLLRAEQSATQYLEISPSISGSPGILLENPSVTGQIGITGGALTVFTQAGKGSIQIASGADAFISGTNVIFNASGYIRVPHWIYLYNNATLRNLQQDLDMKANAFVGKDAMISVVTGFNGSIPVYAFLTFANGVLTNIVT